LAPGFAHRHVRDVIQLDLIDLALAKAETAAREDQLLSFLDAKVPALLDGDVHVVSLPVEALRLGQRRVVEGCTGQHQPQHQRQEQD
jgi:hypothetical protein